MAYTTNIHFAGCLPEGDAADLPLYNTVAEAWRGMLDGLGDDAWDEDGNLKPAAVAMEINERNGRCGTVWDDDYSVAYEVDYADELEDMCACLEAGCPNH